MSIISSFPLYSLFSTPSCLLHLALYIAFLFSDHLITVYIFPQGAGLEANKSAGLIISDHSLVLQKVRRGSAGVYMCAAQNREGKGVSNNVKLNVMCEYTGTIYMSHSLLTRISVMYNIAHKRKYYENEKMDDKYGRPFYL